MLIACELLVVVLFIEVLVRCMPRSLRRASLENCYRVDGTVSERRQSREGKARNRLRRDLTAVFAYVLLIGNGFLFAIDRLVIPVPVVVAALKLVDSDFDKWNRSLEQDRLTAALRDWHSHGRPAGADKDSVVSDSLRRVLPLVIVGTMVLILAVLVILYFGVIRAYREFATGVKTRDERYFKIDMSRMAVNGSEFAVDVIAARLNPPTPPVPESQE